MPRRVFRDPTTASMIAATLVLSSAVGIQTLYKARNTPVGFLDYPVQRVANRIPGVDGPAALVTDEGLTVRGTKCNNSHRAIKLSGVTSWLSADPPGTVIHDGSGSTTREPGCFTTIYINPIPAAVVERTRELIDGSHGNRKYVTWVISGIEIPNDPLIKKETWETEPFDLYLTAP